MSHTRNTNDFLNIENSNRFVDQGGSRKPQAPSPKRQAPRRKPQAPSLKPQAQNVFESESNQ